MAEENVDQGFGKTFELSRRREEVGKPSQEWISFVMRQQFPSIKAHFVGFLEKPHIVLQDLSKYKLDVQKKKGMNLSRPRLCANFLLENMSNQSMGMAEDALNKSDIEKFRFFFDFAIGLRSGLHKIPRAEDELSDQGEENRLFFLSHLGEASNISTVEEIGAYLSMKGFDKESLRLLREDRSGFKLMDVPIEISKYPSFQVPEYMLAGAELARYFYKKLYEIAAPLYPEKPSK